MIDVRNLNISIDDAFNTLILFENEKDAKDFSLKIAGIIKDDIYYLDENIYQNNIYFKERIYIDNEKCYLNNLNVRALSQKILKIYKKPFEEEFKRLRIDTKLRLESIREHGKYKFNPYSLVNDILALSILNIRIFYLALDNLDNDKINILKNEFLTRKSNIFVEKIEDINKYEGFIDEIIIFYKDRIKKFNSFDKILKVKKDQNSNHISIIKNLISENEDYYYTSIDALNDKCLKNIKYQEIDIMDLGK